VLCTDPYVTSDPDLVPLPEVLKGSDVLIVGAPHPEYEGLEVSVPVVDIWNVLDGSVQV
jgi:UDP-N-acetyl-D-mannosaminuronic acid dehydrogenase